MASILNRYYEGTIKMSPKEYLDLKNLAWKNPQKAMTKIAVAYGKDTGMRCFSEDTGVWHTVVGSLFSDSAGKYCYWNQEVNYWKNKQTQWKQDKKKYIQNGKLKPKYKGNDNLGTELGLLCQDAHLGVDALKELSNFAKKHPTVKKTPTWIMFLTPWNTDIGTDMKYHQPVKALELTNKRVEKLIKWLLYFDESMSITGKTNSINIKRAK